jgi:hypothetical protein
MAEGPQHVVETRNGHEATPSPGRRAAAVVRGVGAGTADLTENVTRTAGAAVAESVRSSARVWGDLVEVAVDGVVALVQLSTGRRHPRSGGRGSGAGRCIDLIDVRTDEQIDEALSAGLAAAAPRRRTAAAAPRRRTAAME